MNVGTKNGSLLFHLLVAVLLAAISVSESSLFSSDEPISQLQLHNFSSVIHNSSKMWIVDYYASWCGYCQKLAPEFSRMARSVQGWSDVVGVAAVACSDSANTALCRSFSINGYPTVRFFPPNSETSFKGFRYEGDKLTAGLVTAILNFLKQFIDGGNTDRSWPVFDYIRHPQALRSGGARHIYIVVEDKSMADAFFGLQVILDSLTRRPEVVVGRMKLSDAEFNGITGPGLYESTSSGGLILLSSEKDQQKISQLIKSFDHNEQTVTVDSTVQPSQPTYRLAKDLTNPAFIYKPSQGLHMQDLESSLYYSFWVEIPSKEIFNDEALQALKEYMNILDKYHTGEPQVKRFLNLVKQWLSGLRAPLTAAAWLQKLNSFQSNVANIRESLRWTGCNGSLPHFRGYPCSLWMTFHAITVSAYVKENTNASFNPIDILIPIRGYVKNFFTCRPCAAHFFSMAQNLEEINLVPRDVVLWLWKRHNLVNFRLHGDVTEDPEHPKVQFPSYEACPECRIAAAADVRFNMTDDMWNEDDVLAYFLRYYGQNYIVDDDIEGFSPKLDGTTTMVTRSPSRTTAASCSPMATDWTPCSRTCDVGTSMRMTMSSSTGCQLLPEVRLCLRRPCTTQFPDWSESRWHIANCPRHGHTYRLVKDIPLSYGNCSTGAEFWRVCGKCPGIRNRPICCRPSRSSTQPRQVTCVGRDSNGMVNSVTGTMLVEVIDYCRCDDNCSD